MRILITILVSLMLASCSSAKKQAQSEPSSEEKTSETPSQIKSHPTANTAITAEKEIWIKRDVSDLPDLEKRIEPSSFDLYHCDYEAVLAMLEGEKTSISLPTLDGFMTFEIQNSNTMSEALAVKFPNIKSFKGKSTDGGYSIRLDTNDDGLFAEISNTSSKILISPYLKGNTAYYAVYNESAITPNKRDKSFE